MLIVQECIKQLNDDVPEMFDIPLVTSALDVVLCKLVDSAKFKVSVPQDILAAHKAHPDGQTPSTHDTLPSDHESPVTPSPLTLPSNQCHPTNFTAVHRRKDTHLPQVPNVFDCESRPVLPTSRDEPVGGGRRQASLLFKVKKPLRVSATLFHQNSMLIFFRLTLHSCATWRSVPLTLVMMQTWSMSYLSTTSNIY
jgi:hypothetical protein